MIVYKHIIEKLEKANYNIDSLLEEGVLSEKILDDIRNERLVNMGTIDIICSLLKCRISDVIEYIPDESEEGEEIAFE